ncbi:hypothetical protein PFISCL1PPCAC_14938, partial [Pristionchus fissidentatus]
TKGDYRFLVTPSIPDCRVIRVGETRFIVSATTLALFSPVFLNLFYGGNNGEVIFDLSEDSTVFAQLLEIVNGSIPRGISPDVLVLLDKLDRLDVIKWKKVKVREYSHSEITNIVRQLMKWMDEKNKLSDNEIMTLTNYLHKEDLPWLYGKITKTLK